MYLNDSLVASANDDAISEPGTVGLYANGEVWFDDLNVAEITAEQPATESLPFQDGFNRADNTDWLDQGWVEQSGDYAIRGHSSVALSATDSLATLTGIDASDIVISADVNSQSSQAVGLVARYTDASTPSFYLGRLTADGDAEIVKCVGGTMTTLASVSSGSLSGSLRFELNGDLLQLFLNDRLVTSTNDSSIASSGTVGIWGAGNASASASKATLDNFDARLPQDLKNIWLTVPTDSSAKVQYWSPGTTLTDVQVGDFNGDGKRDVAGFDPATGAWKVGISQGESGFSTSTWATWSTSSTWNNVLVGDFNGDGRADIAAERASDGAWYVSTSSGSSFTTSQWTSWGTAAGWTNVSAGDVDGDHRQDIIAYNSTTGAWQVALSDGTAFANRSFGSWGNATPYTHISVGDFDGDGRADVAGYDATTGTWRVGISSGNKFHSARGERGILPQTGKMFRSATSTGTAKTTSSAKLLAPARSKSAFRPENRSRVTHGAVQQPVFQTFASAMSMVMAVPILSAKSAAHAIGMLLSPRAAASPISIG